MMTIVRVKGVKRFRDRHGKWRCYHRKTGLPIKAEFGSGEFFAELARLEGLAVHVGGPRPGSLRMLIAEYRGSASFTDLARRTRADYQKVFDYLRPIADTPLSKFDRPLIVRIRDKASGRGRRFANYVKAVLSIVFGWGAERGYLDVNPAKAVKNIRRPKGTPHANRPWTDAERHAVLDSSPEHLKPAIALMMFTGLGPEDALHLPRSFYKDGDIATTRSKTGEPVFWPAPTPLKQILAAAAAHDAVTLCANSRGRPWTTSGFRASWRTFQQDLLRDGRIGPGLTLYGLRHTVAVILRECGFDERTIADALGQKTIEMARHYSRGADLRPKMRGVVAAFDREVNERRTKVVKPT
jgi:integrase